MGGGWWRFVQLRIKNYDKAIVVSTRGEVAEIENAVRAAAEFFVKFDHTTPVPIRNLYATPETLGYDRLAAAVGAHDMIATGALGRVEAALVVDFGTAITYDVVTAAGEFLGGNISPGVASRFRAMHEHTGALPMGALPEAAPEFPARETKTAIGSGVAWGIAAETERYILEAEEKFGTVGVIFTGGDADYFARRVKFPIFAVSELVFRGLNAILEHNANL
ncbi:MAG: type III pantothenate kinase [Alistipes sp.]|jgi:type III pantothenate kinase|nr:type III pantothenate kinase [Alistipes sp.]